MSFLKIKLLSFLTEKKNKSRNKDLSSNTTIRTSLALINDQGFPTWGLLEDRAKVARVRDSFVGGNEDVILHVRVPGFRYIVGQLVPPHNLATLGFAIVGDHP